MDKVTASNDALNTASAIAKNPALTLLSLISFFVGFLFLKSKIKYFFSDLSKSSTESGKSDFLKYQVKKNEENSKKDNKGRNDLRNMK